MSLPKIQSLTDTDVKILLALIEKQTLEELCKTSGVPYSYAQKKLRKLKAKRFVQTVDKDGQAFVYQTCRLPETERLFDLRSSSTANGKLYHIPHFYGQSRTVGDAVKWIIEYNTKSNANYTLWEIIKWSTAILKVRSYRKYNGEPGSQPPTEQRMREILGVHIAKAEKELALAKELYETDFLWSGDKNIWQVLSEGNPTEQTMKLYKEAGAKLG